MNNYIIRKIGSEEIKLLDNFLYEAIFQKDEKNILPIDIINEPQLKHYIEDFGKQDDYCLVSEVVGAIWTRI